MLDCPLLRPPGSRTLTHGSRRSISVQRFVAEAERLGEVLEVGVLCHQVPKRVVSRNVAVGDGDLHSPVFLIVELDMPMDLYGAHVISAE